MIGEIDHTRDRAETAGADRKINDPDEKPRATRDFGDAVQIPPDNGAGGGSEQRKKRIDDRSDPAWVWADETKLPEGRQIHIRKGEKSAKIQEFAGMFKRVAEMLKHDGPNKSNRADDQDVVGRSVGAGAEMSEDPSRQHVVAAHSE